MVGNVQTIETVTNISDTLVLSVTSLIIGVFIYLYKVKQCFYKQFKEDEDNIRTISNEEAIKVAQQEISPLSKEVNSMKVKIGSIEKELHNINKKLDKANENSRVIGRELSAISASFQLYISKDRK